MADFCEECNKPKAENKDAAKLPVYCQCSANRKEGKKWAEVAKQVAAIPKGGTRKFNTEFGMWKEVKGEWSVEQFVRNARAALGMNGNSSAYRFSFKVEDANCIAVTKVGSWEEKDMERRETLERITEKATRTVSVTSRPPVTEAEENIEINIREQATTDALEIIGETEKDEAFVATKIDYEAVLEDLMGRYTELGIAVTAIRKILREQGKDPDI